MKKLLILGMILFYSLTIRISLAADPPQKTSDKKQHYWFNIFPIGMEIESLAIAPKDANTLYASVDRGENRRGLFKSVNGGNLWFPMAGFKTDKKIANSVVKVDPTNGEIVYFGWGSVKYMSDSYYGEMWRSPNGGINWENISAGVIKSVNDIAINPKNPEIIYVASSVGLYKTLNGGKTWGEIVKGEYYWVRLNSESPDEIYAGLYEYRDWGQWAVYPYRSTDGGQSFELVIPHMYGEGKKERCYWWDIEFISKELIAACSTAGSQQGGAMTDIIKSSDSGKIWTLIAEKPFVEYIGQRKVNVFGERVFESIGNVKSLRIHPNDKNITYSIIKLWDEKQDRILKSTDSGKTWELLPVPPFTDIKHFEISPSNRILVSTPQGLYKSADAGKTWESASFGLPTKIGGDKKLVEVDKDQVIYIGGRDKYWTSNDKGFSWKLEPSRKKLREYVYEDLPLSQVFHASDGITYFVYFNHGVYKVTADKEPIRLNFNTTPMFLAVSPSNSQILYAVGDDESHPRMYTTESFGSILLKSEDAGFSWTKIDWQRWIQVREKGIWSDITLLSVDSKSPDILYATIRHEARGIGAQLPSRYVSLLKTTDGGKTWADITRQIYHSATTSLQSVWASSKWLNSKERPDIANMLALSAVTSLVIDPSNSNIVYITTSAGGVYRSDDAGKTWKFKAPSDYIKMLIGVFDNYSAQQCRGKKGCKVTLDIALQKRGKGQFFIQAPPNTVIVYPQKIVNGIGFSFNNIAIDPSNSKVIYLATGKGVYRSSDRGEKWELLDSGLLDNTVKKVIASSSMILAEGESGIYKLSE